MKKEVIESYQTGKSETYGDILTKRERKEIKVGLLIFAYFEYWRMYEGLEEEVKSGMEEIVKNMSKSDEYNLIYPGFLDTVDKANSAGDMLKKENIDLLVIVEGTYAPDYMVLQAIRKLQNIPIIFLITQDRKVLSRKDLRYRDVVGNSGFVGLNQLSGSFSKMNYNRYSR